MLGEILQHGRPPVSVELSPGELVVRDAGGGPPSLDGSGLGLTLVRQVVENGLFGSVSLRDGAIHVSFDPTRDAHPRR